MPPSQPSDLRATLASHPGSFEAALLDIVQQGVIVTDVQGTVVYWNAFAERLYGWTAEEAIGQSIVTLTPTKQSTDDAVAIMSKLSRGESWSGDFAVRRRDGSEFLACVVDSPIFDASGELAGIVGISCDVTAQRALEAQVRQSAKLEAVGRLARGVAHDFNNLLTVVLGNVDVSLDMEPLTTAGREALEEVRTAAERAAQLTRQLLAFSRQQRTEKRVVDLHAATERTMPLLHRILGDDIALTLHAGVEPLHVEIDLAQYDQTLSNLLLNARDAMPGGGTIDIRLEAVTSPDASAQPDAAGAFVRLLIADTGAGMPPDVAARLFEPFFSTKEVGRGTGLGLAVVFGFVQESGGTITVDSTVGAGTTVCIVLPRVPQRAAYASPFGGAATIASPIASPIAEGGSPSRG